MSGIYIHGMDIPEHGSIVLVEVDENGDVYAAYDSGITKLAQYKAVPVPPHGDLIDRDSLMKGEGRYIISFGKEGIDVAEINRAPTIIPADESNMDSFIRIF